MFNPAPFLRRKTDISRYQPARFRSKTPELTTDTHRAKPIHSPLVTQTHRAVASSSPRTRTLTPYVALLAMLVVGLLAILQSWSSVRSRVELVAHHYLPSTYIRNPNLALVDNGAASLASYNAVGSIYTNNARWLSLHPEYADGSSPMTEGMDCGGANAPLHTTADPDRRWCLMGSRGQLGIILAYPGRITNVSIAHPPSFSGLPNAPRDIIVWGVVDGETNEGIYVNSGDVLQDLRSRLPVKTPFPRYNGRAVSYVPLAAFSYNIRNIDLFQMFDVFPEVHQVRMDFGIIVVQIVSNWGELSFTALHHVGIYGERADVTTSGRD
ncbi:hypothetical protein QCA50_016056 [Cerrena zonata]|uniref:SUN domain-containing protein n=1 Tax=Cerrena zonata TaxID=2478898 RepID=A0AAW0FT85_9APHY